MHALVPAEGKPLALAVPGGLGCDDVNERAIGTDQGIKYVYVVNAKNIVERRDVETDRLFDGLIAIKSGLKPQDWVIVNGTQRAREGATVNPQQAPMPTAAPARTPAPDATKH